MPKVIKATIKNIFPQIIGDGNITPSTINDLSMIEIRDIDNHLLFKYDSLSDIIEIKSRGKVFCIGISHLHKIGQRNILAEVPTTSINAEGSDDRQAG